MHDQEGDGEPAHHARRPMNAFLIFCKRHRSVVRDKYPNLENRSITKILGEWWANLEKEEKACYTGLAKQYKDAFFNANPDFKWYKLPAPPLRTLSSRPREPNENKFLESPVSPQPQEELEKTNNNSTKVDLNKKPLPEHSDVQSKSLSMFTPGKLADEAQMGGLSSLLATKTETPTTNPYYSPPSVNKFSTISVPKKEEPQHIDALQDELTVTTIIFGSEFDSEGNEQKANLGSPNDQFTNQDVIDQIVDKRYSKDEDSGYQNNCSDDEKNTKCGRSCKGKRYQAFMAEGGLMTNKRQKRDSEKMSDDSNNATCSWDSGNLRDEPHNANELKEHVFDEKPAEAQYKFDECAELDNNVNKTFKAADFDLDAKIKALPSLSLEKFQQKKRENKRKKKTINLKPIVFEPSHNSHIVNSVPVSMLENRRHMMESWRDHVIGSQKRKPRKMSINRFHHGINSMVSSVDHKEGQKISPEIKIATEAPSSVMHQADCQTGASALTLDGALQFRSAPHADLLALATLAEVAANTSKLDATRRPTDQHASMV